MSIENRNAIKTKRRRKKKKKTKYICSLETEKQGHLNNVINTNIEIRNIKQKYQILLAITFMLSPINHVRICYDKKRITHALFSGHQEHLNYGILNNKYAYGPSGTWDSSNPGFHSRLSYRST